MSFVLSKQKNYDKIKNDMNKKRFNDLSSHLKAKFGERTLKICIDGGFTCPTRDGLKSANGCIFCSGRGSGDHLCPLPIKTQVQNYLDSYKKDRANKFIVYFQNFTNTYADINTLEQKYTEALSCSDKIVGIAIATRPDCINKDVVALLKKLSNTYYVVVELGLQTANEETGKKINRCYTNKDFTEATSLLHDNGIDTIVHIMVGLPGESHKDVVDTINFINKSKIKGIKIHNTYILKNTFLETLYNNHEYTPIDYEDYMEELIYILTHIRPELIVHRISGDPPKSEFIAPSFCTNKKLILNGLTKLMHERHLYQGMYFNQK